MSASIRIATDHDVPVLAGLNRYVQELHAQREPADFQTWDREATERYFVDELARVDNVTFLAEHEGQPVGYLLGLVRAAVSDAFRARTPSFVVEHIAVSPNARRSGVGTALLKQAEQEARSRGIDRLELTYWAFNSSAEAFFRGLGIEPSSIRARRLL